MKNQSMTLVKHSKKSKGFTMIELILGLMLFSMISMTLFSVYASGMRLSRDSQKNDSIYREARWTLLLMTNELENIISYTFANSYPEKTSFSGEANQLGFVLPTQDGLKYVSYYLVPESHEYVHKVIVGDTYKKNVDVYLSNTVEDEHFYLIRQESPFIDFLAGEEKEGETEIIATQLKRNGLKLEYGYLENEASTKSSWKGIWNFSGIPMNVRISLQFTNENKSKDNNEIEDLIFTKEIYIPQGSQGDFEET